MRSMQHNLNLMEAVKVKMKISLRFSENTKFNGIKRKRVDVLNSSTPKKNTSINKPTSDSNKENTWEENNIRKDTTSAKKPRQEKPKHFTPLNNHSQINRTSLQVDVLNSSTPYKNTSDSNKENIWEENNIRKDTTSNKKTRQEKPEHFSPTRKSTRKSPPPRNIFDTKVYSYQKKTTEQKKHKNIKKESNNDFKITSSTKKYKRTKPEFTFDNLHSTKIESLKNVAPENSTNEVSITASTKKLKEYYNKTADNTSTKSPKQPKHSTPTRKSTRISLPPRNVYDTKVLVYLYKKETTVQQKHNNIRKESNNELTITSSTEKYKGTKPEFTFDNLHSTKIESLKNIAPKNSTNEVLITASTEKLKEYYNKTEHNTSTKNPKLPKHSTPTRKSTRISPPPRNVYDRKVLIYSYKNETTKQQKLNNIRKESNNELAITSSTKKHKGTKPEFTFDNLHSTKIESLNNDAPENSTNEVSITASTEKLKEYYNKTEDNTSTKNPKQPKHSTPTRKSTRISVPPRNVYDTKVLVYPYKKETSNLSKSLQVKRKIIIGNEQASKSMISKRQLYSASVWHQSQEYKKFVDEISMTNGQNIFKSPSIFLCKA
ncbi:unnamed protein product [Brassicogethes aeneus]|uniref:Uncharacterized protein n=1 Tax=Brassicogethes aeneus TaxID=1431903 RepID=A0A9P0FBR4_BRAAE|nr:unnamed protein product [Brassicogethes aeneus]